MKFPLTVIRLLFFGVSKSFLPSWRGFTGPSSGFPKGDRPPVSFGLVDFGLAVDAPLGAAAAPDGPRWFGFGPAEGMERLALHEDGHRNVSRREVEGMCMVYSCTF